MVIFLYGFTSPRNSIKKVHKINVEFEQGDNLFMNYEMVNKLLIQNNKEVKNLAKSVIDLHNLESYVLSHPMVENAAIYLTVDGTLKTKVKQRKPIGRVNTLSESYYIDIQGVKMPLSKNYSARVPLITGDINDNDIDDIFKLTKEIYKNDFFKKQIVGLSKYDENKYILTTRTGDHKIELGNVNDLKQKFKNLKAFYNKTLYDKTIQKYQIINLEFNNQVVCTK